MSKQKWITTVALPIIAALFFVGVGFGMHTIVFSQKHSSLVDAVPKDAELWVLNRGAGLTVQVEAALQAVGVEESVTDVLKNQKHKIAIYRENGRWFKVTGSAVQGRQKGGAPHTLLNNPTLQVVGFLSVAHVKNVLGKFAAIVDASTPYYFALREKEGEEVAFTFIKENAVKQALLEEYDYSFSPTTWIVFKLAESPFALAAREQIKSKFIESVAFTHPVVVSTELPDKTVMQEKVLKPEVFTWEEIAAHRFKLVVDKKMIAKYKVTEQLDNFKNDISYYYDEGFLIVGKEEDVDAILLEQRILSYPTFFYMTLGQEGDFAPVDILGKSEALSWLQKLAAQSIMIIEDKDGFYGEIGF